jgi:hypothetical protein
VGVGLCYEENIAHGKFCYVWISHINFTGKDFLNLNSLFKTRKETLLKSQIIAGN